MQIIDVPDPQRVSGEPDDRKILLRLGNFIQDEFLVRHVELRLYKAKTRNEDSLITSFVDTDKGSIEMLYQTLHNDQSLEHVAEFLISQLGISALIVRSVIAIRPML